MENVNGVLATNIFQFRRKSGLSQDELAQKLGVTFQAVSKWENAKAAPDIAFLPMLADIFGCCIDELFGRQVQTEVHFDHCGTLPWNDDNTLRGVVCLGRKILKVTDGLTDRFTFELVGDAKSVKSECSIAVNGSVSGGCGAGDSITVSGSVSGGCSAGDSITVSGLVSGGCNAGDSITAGGDISGGCSAGDSITCKGDLNGTVTCGGSVTVTGDVEAELIRGSVICSSLKCDKIEGNVTVTKAD